MSVGWKSGRWMVVGLCLLAAACSRSPDPTPAATPPAVAAPGLAVSPGATLKAVRARGKVNCGVHEDAGFAYRDRGGWRGFDVDLCRAVAAAVLGDARAVNIVAQTNKSFSPLQTGQVDLLARGAAWTFTRDVGLQLEFVGVSYYDRQGFLTPTKLNFHRVSELGRGRVCVVAATTAESNLVEYFKAKNLNIKRVVLDTEELARRAYEAGGCEALSDDVSVLAANRAVMADPNAQTILPETISKEPLGPVVRQGDDQWGDIVRWTLNTMILAEELGVSSQNVDQARRKPTSDELGRLLAGDGEFGPMLSLRGDWAFQIVRQVGAYGEVFDRNIGPATPIGLERGLNALWNADPPGLLFSPPMR